MTVPVRPAAYIRIASHPGAPAPAQQHSAIVELARQRGWPEPAVYADEGPVVAQGYGPGLARLSAAIGAGRHDAVLLPGVGSISSSPAQLMAFLCRCNERGVAVEFLSPAGAHACLARYPSGEGRSPSLPPTAARDSARPASRCAAWTADVLTLAGVEALSGLFADWRIWADDHGWPARRRGDVYVQAYQHGSPTFCVHAVSAAELAAQLRWQQAADTHTPAGCASG